MKLIGTLKKFNVEGLREPSIITNYQQQQGKEFEKITKNEQEKN